MGPLLKKAHSLFKPVQKGHTGLHRSGYLVIDVAQVALEWKGPDKKTTDSWIYKTILKGQKDSVKKQIHFQGGFQVSRDGRNGCKRTTREPFGLKHMFYPYLWLWWVIQLYAFTKFHWTAQLNSRTICLLIICQQSCESKFNTQFFFKLRLSQVSGLWWSPSLWGTM